MPEDTTQTIAEDDWAAAMAEQAAPADTPSPAVFQDLSGSAASGGSSVREATMPFAWQKRAAFQSLVAKLR